MKEVYHNMKIFSISENTAKQVQTVPHTYKRGDASGNEKFRSRKIMAPSNIAACRAGGC